jgi:hypothetical protein
MKFFLTACLTAGLAWTGAAQDTRAASRPESSPDAPVRIEALQKEFEALRDRLEKSIDELESDPKKDDEEAKGRLVAEFRGSATKIGAALIAIAESRPTDPAALAAVRVALTTGLDGARLTSALTVLDAHALSESITDVYGPLTGYGDERVEALLRKVLAENPSHRVRGLACFQIAMRTRGEAARERVIERLVKEFADVPHGGETLGAFAERRLFAMRNLRVGKKAPDIEGKDMEGVAFKLSDYRGKVVVLDFWGFW